MKVVANTENGYLIEATQDEVAEVISAVTGNRPNKKEIPIGTKIPAFDYASTLNRAAELANHHVYSYLKTKVQEFGTLFLSLDQAVQEAAKLKQMD